MIKPIFKNETGIVLGTGPSLTPDLVKLCKDSKLPLFGCNNTFEFGLDVHLACNPDWWDFYGSDFPGIKWTWDKYTAAKHNINYIQGRWRPGLSTDPEYIHYHHGSGPQIVNIAYHYGITKMLLVGWDMKYPPKGQRHYFNEYPPPLLHYPKTGPNGEFTGLIREMETIKPEDYGIEIINCTPGSAMKCFPIMRLEDAL